MDEKNKRKFSIKELDAIRERQIARKNADTYARILRIRLNEKKPTE